MLKASARRVKGSRRVLNLWTRSDSEAYALRDSRIEAQRMDDTLELDIGTIYALGGSNLGQL